MFEVDQHLIMHSPYTDEDTEVIYRGRMTPDRAVVYNPATGWQGQVPMDWLRAKEQEA